MCTAESKFLTQNEEELDECEPEKQESESSLVQTNMNLDTDKNTQQVKTIFSLPQTRTVNRKRINNSSIDAQVTKHLKQAGDALQNLTNKTQMQQTQFAQDGAALYGQLLADKLRKLSARSRLILQNKIDNLLFEAELKELDSSQMRCLNTVSVSTMLPPFPSSEDYISSGSPYSSQTSPSPSYTPQPSPSPSYIQQPSPNSTQQPSPCPPYAQHLSDSSHSQPLPQNIISSNEIDMLHNLTGQHKRPIVDYYSKAVSVLNNENPTN